MNPAKTTRRQFLTSTALAAAGLPVLASCTSPGKKRGVAPGEKINMGVIGMGIRGTKNMQQFLKHDDARVVAVCDVSGHLREKARSTVDEHYGDKACTAYNDFRDLLARNDIDAVVVTTPDHWHVLVGLAAARAGKDMYYEKPVGVSIAHAQALRAAIKKHNVVFQFGTQQRSDAKFRFGCELVRNGRIGELKRIKVGAPASKPIPFKPEMPVPADLDYDLWLGPAPWAPYTYERCRPHSKKEGYGSWYHIYDYCVGFIANWGVHHLDIAQWGGGTDDTTPVSVEGTGKFPTEGLGTCCIQWELDFRYANGVEMLYTDNQGKCQQGIRFEGSEGWVYVRRKHLEAHPESLLTSKIAPGEIHLPVSDDHFRHFLDCVRSRQETISPIETAVHSDTICQLANIATRTGRKLNWDPGRERFSDDDEANGMLMRPLRAPWTLEA